MLRLFFFLSIGGLSANAASVLPCTPEILDVQVLEPNTAHHRHILAIELQNRSQSGGPLLGPTVQLLPESGADTFTNSFLVTRS